MLLSVVNAGYIGWWTSRVNRANNRAWWRAVNKMFTSLILGYSKGIWESERSLKSPRTLIQSLDHQKSVFLSTPKSLPHPLDRGNLTINWIHSAIICLSIILQRLRLLCRHVHAYFLNRDTYKKLHPPLSFNAPFLKRIDSNKQMHTLEIRERQDCPNVISSLSPTRAVAA